MWFSIYVDFLPALVLKKRTKEKKKSRKFVSSFVPVVKAMGGRHRLIYRIVV